MRERERDKQREGEKGRSVWRETHRGIEGERKRDFRREKIKKIVR